jgi:acyl carrier protein
MSNTAARIAQFLKDAKPTTKGGVAEILASKDLFTDGWMDSLLHLSLLGFVEKEFGVKVPALCVSRKSFLTVNSIAALVNK